MSANDVSKFWHALFDFKRVVYQREWEHAFHHAQVIEQDSDNSSPEPFIEAARGVVSDFLIDVFDVLDKVSGIDKHRSAESITKFWTSIEGVVEDSFSQWVDKITADHHFSNEIRKQIKEDIKEFVDRALRFHAARQMFAISGRNVSA
ncbi:MAG: hypothetical protein H7A37_07080 [Chlamydiales bacterium]|nr:hypothetical protein [Chlamydiia bacterium]MCP5508045.1 hypothetical protein [Chlamydiales bacterium]